MIWNKGEPVSVEEALTHDQEEDSEMADLPEFSKCCDGLSQPTPDIWSEKLFYNT